MDNPAANPQEQRGDYINNWYRVEKSAIRMAGVLLLFVAALLAVFDQPSDEWTLLAIVGSISGGITLLTLSRQARSARSKLRFLNPKTQTTRASFAGMGAMLLITQLGMRPLALIIGGVLLALAAWYQWRTYKINKFDQLFKVEEADPESEGEKSI